MILLFEHRQVIEELMNVEAELNVNVLEELVNVSLVLGRVVPRLVLEQRLQQVFQPYDAGPLRVEVFGQSTDTLNGDVCVDVFKSSPELVDKLVFGNHRRSFEQ